MAITMARHVKSVAGSGATSIVATRQGMVEQHRIRRRKWSRIVAVTTACQGVMEPRRIRRGEWSRVVAEVRLESDFRKSLDGDHLSRNLDRDLQQEFRTKVRLPWEPGQSLPIAGVRDEVRLP